MFSRSLPSFALSALSTLLPALAFAQAPVPKFQYASGDPPKLDVPAEKKLQAKGGLLYMAGNSEALTGSLGAQGSYQEAANRFAAEANAAYARTGFIVDRNANMLLEPGELEPVSRTTSKLFSGKARYDRFLTLNNAVYVSGQALTDVPAGKELVAGGQVGYSRQLFKDERRRVVAEVGYDFSVERAAAAGADLVQIHSGRLFLGSELKLSDSSGMFANLEALSNLNAEKAPVAGTGEVAAFDDTRLTGKIGLTTTLWKNLSFAFSFGARWDQAPAPLKAPGGTMFAPGFQPLADELDTTTEATLVVTFL
jgi:hypothetical protein